MSVHKLNSVNMLQPVETGMNLTITGELPTSNMPTTTFTNSTGFQGSIGNCLPYYDFLHQPQFKVDYTYPYRVRPVMNGFIVATHKGEFAFTTAEEVGKFIADQIKESLPK